MCCTEEQSEQHLHCSYKVLYAFVNSTMVQTDTKSGKGVGMFAVEVVHLQ